MKNKIKEYITDNQLFTQKDKLLVTVSGGVDSVVLCHLLNQIGYDFSIAHCNFQLRGEESDGDETFVKTLSEEYKSPFYTQKFETNQYVLDHKISVQLAARELRYAWFEELKCIHEFNYILTAHHASDNIETVLYNFAKGTGLLGLTGMKPKNNALVRPLLWAKKEDILAFAQAENLSYREDSSNISDKYSRNFIRHNIVPDFKNINPNFESTAVENIKRLNEAKDLLDYVLEKIKIETTEVSDNQLFIDRNKLQTYPSVSTVLFELIREFGFNASQIVQILKEDEYKTGTVFHSITHKLLIDRDQYIVVEKRVGEGDINSFSISKDDSFIKNRQIEFTIEFSKTQNLPFPSSPNSVLLDADKLVFPLVLRKWQEADRFQPLGMHGQSQLLSDFFRLKKLTLFEKEKVWILETADKHICWVVGFRIDERFKILESSKSFANITVTHSESMKYL